MQRRISAVLPARTGAVLPARTGAVLPARTGAALLLCLLALTCPQTRAAEREVIRGHRVSFSPGISGNSLVRPNRTGTVRTPELSLSTVQLCQPDQPCTACVRARVRLDARVVLRLREVHLHLLELKSNHQRVLRVLRRGGRGQANSTWDLVYDHFSSGHKVAILHRENWTPGTWELTYDCFESDGGHKVAVFLKTIPRRQRLQQSRTYTVEDHRRGPVFSYSLDRGRKAVTVSVFPGPEVKVRLCYRHLFVCDDLPSPVTARINTSQSLNATLSFPFLVPCLCIEVFYLHHDSWRRTACLSKDFPHACDDDLWHASKFFHRSSEPSGVMSLEFHHPCPIQLSASLCWRTQGTALAPCQEIANSTIEERDSVFRISGVDRHPRLCFKLSYGNSNHVECPSEAETEWSVEVDPEFLRIHLHITTTIPASFSAVLCRPEREGAACDPQLPVHTITRPSGSSEKELHMILGTRAVGLCVQVWRSDSQYFGKRLICPEYAYSRLGLVATAMLIVAVSMAMLVFFGYRFARRVRSGSLWTRTPVLLLYTADSEEHVSLVCALASLLQGELCCEVHLDLWDSSGLGGLGPVPWLYSQREAVWREEGRVLLLWSRGGRELYESWKRGEQQRQQQPADLLRNTAPKTQADPHGIFQTALACLHSDVESGRAGDYALLYFDGSQRDIPDSFKGVPRFKLPRQGGGLLQELHRGDPWACWLRLGIAGLQHSEAGRRLEERARMCRLLEAERAGLTEEPEFDKSDELLIHRGDPAIGEKRTGI
ncbi:interleukin-17 receptor E [Acipenser oxyrinchus oxyrinchus]|uniref:Interleukin-17 receptor E n=1 Tax=Acipenser oxyrinchus oxyrinchus TaxID=40147 RepID=A0AAD8CVD7_ACIOX|nr:interleukin-17 receptor E [Acipenser oxyrinchus oxyrinchus]